MKFFRRIRTQFFLPFRRTTPCVFRKRLPELIFDTLEIDSAAYLVNMPTGEVG